MRQVLVTAGVVLDEQGRVLIAQRKPGAHAANLWEFPGGRLEVGETPEAGLKRELQEELSITVTDLCLFDVVSHVYAEADLHVVLLVYAARLKQNTTQAIDCQAFAWVYPCNLEEYHFSEADKTIVHRLQSEGVPLISESQRN